MDDLVCKINRHPFLKVPDLLYPSYRIYHAPIKIMLPKLHSAVRGTFTTPFFRSTCTVNGNVTMTIIQRE